MRVLVEQQEAADLGTLDAAWSGRETFLFTPARSAVAPEWLSAALEALPDDLRTDHFGLLTSGSTGTPKLVLGSRTRAEQLARTLHLLQQSEPVRQTIVALPLSYSYAFVNQWLWARVFGRGIVRTAGLAHRSELLDALKSAEDAMLCLVGTQAAMLSEVFAHEVFEGVLRLHFAGGAFPQKQLPQVRRIFPAARIFNNYGCAEAMPRLTIRPAEDSDEGADVGPPIPGVELRSGAEGQLEFRSAYGAVAFFDDSGLHRVAAGEWLPTGDLGSIDERGHCHLTGRANEVFKRHGEKIALPSLLQSLRASWRGGAAFYRERDPAGEEAHVLVLAPPPSQDEVQALLQLLRKRHARAAWPLRIESVAELPTLPNGKTDTGALARTTGKHIHWRQRI